MNKTFDQYNRLFTFGCSFTQYHWPTWADILGCEFKNFQNWAISGGGNDFILNRLIECHQRNTINKDDLVIVMWSGVTREDYYNSGWRLYGNIYSSHNQENVLKTRCPQGYLLKSLNYITAAKLILDSIGCEYYFLSMMPIRSLEFDVKHKPSTEILNLYSNILDIIKPSVQELIYKSGTWWNIKYGAKITINGKTGIDPHPVPIQHLEFLNKTFPDLQLSKQTIEFVERWNKRIINLTREDHDKIVEPFKHGNLYPVPDIKAF